MPKQYIEFKGFENYASRLEKLGGSIEKTTEKALVECHKEVTPGIKQAIIPHRRTGKTERALVEDTRIKWDRCICSIPIGFDIRNKGAASILLMWGTPRFAPDKNLYNSVYGSGVKRKIRKIQKEIFNEEIVKQMTQ